jgi:hypothetical protein
MWPFIKAFIAVGLMFWAIILVIFLAQRYWGFQIFSGAAKPSHQDWALSILAIPSGPHLLAGVFDLNTPALGLDATEAPISDPRRQPSVHHHFLRCKAHSISPLLTVDEKQPAATIVAHLTAFSADLIPSSNFRLSFSSH